MTSERIFFNFPVTADSHTLKAYQERGGYQALENALKTLQPIDVEKEVMASGLRGRGGAGFPTGSKWSFVNKKAPQEIKDMWRKGTMMTFSPSGVFEMDDGENWEYSTRSNAGFVTRQQDLYLGLGHDTRVENTDLPGNVFQGQINEANQRAFYQRWLDLMKSESWKNVPQRDVPKMKEGV